MDMYTYKNLDPYLSPWPKPKSIKDLNVRHEMLKLLEEKSCGNASKYMHIKNFLKNILPND